MSQNFDLKKEESLQGIVGVRKITKRPRFLFRELLKTIFVVVIVSFTVWCVSRADDDSLFTKPTIKNWNAMGTVVSLKEKILTINNNKGVEGIDNNYVIDVSQIKKIETKSYVSLTIDDISAGDSVIVQGTIDGTVINARRIISLSITAPRIKEEATSTEEVATSTATTTGEVATSTIDKITGFISDIVGKITDKIEGSTTVDFVSSTTEGLPDDTSTTSVENINSTSTPSVENSTSTATTTEEVATSTIDTVTDDATETTTDENENSTTTDSSQEEDISASSTTN